MNSIKRFFIRNRIWIFVILGLLCIKVIWVVLGTQTSDSLDNEKEEILQRRNWLVEKICVEPSKLLSEMPADLDAQFRGEWAIYSCAMLSKALVNIAVLYPETKEESALKIDHLIQMVMSREMKYYDAMRWGEDPLKSLESENSHVSYLSLLAWMIGNYKSITNDSKYDDLYETLCETMNRRILNSKTLNIPTYPNEGIYFPDMLVAIVALHQNGKYSDTVNKWLTKAKKEWLNKDNGILVATADTYGNVYPGVDGSYAALSCYYLSMVDEEFAKSQYEKLKKTLLKEGVLTGFKEYPEYSPIFSLDMDAGPILFGLSPSGTAFAIGPATFFNDTETRNSLLRTAEIVGHSVKWKDKRHYLLSNFALVGEAVTLAMRTHSPNIK